MNKITLILSILVFIASSCGQKPNKQESVETHKDAYRIVKSTEVSNTVTPDFETMELDFGFKVTVGKKEDFESFKTYTSFKLERNKNILYLDSLINRNGQILCTEYEFGNELFPIILRTGNNSFELLFEVNNRPNKNYLKRFFVSDDKLIGQDKLPTFEGNPIDVNNDGIKEYAGFWDYSQIWGEDNNLTAYNPILYYSVTNTGLKLDSLLTIQRNEMIYGQFYGFSFSEEKEQPISVEEKFVQELKIITGKK